MEIAYYSHFFAPEIGAPSARIYDLGREWVRSGHGVRVVTCFPNHPAGVIYPGYRARAYMRENIDGIEVHRLWSYFTRNRGILRRTIGHISFMISAILAPVRAERGADVIIGTSPTLFAAMAAAQVAARQNVPFVMEVRDLWPAIFADLGVLRNGPLLHLLESMELALYRRAAGIVTVTDAFSDDLVSRGVPAGKICTIPNGVDENFWQPGLADRSRWREQLGIDDRFVVLYIGAHGLSQGLSTIVQTAALVRDDPSIVFVLVGEGAEKKLVIREAAAAGLDNIRFVDPVDKAAVRDFYASADACLVPLRDVPLLSKFIPSKMFEIMAMNRPIVASVRGEAAGILEKAGAIVVPPGDSAAMAEAVRKLRAGAFGAAIGSGGRAFVEAHYTRQSLAARYSLFLDETRARFREGVR